MQLIIFDVDGTLTQTNNLDDQCFKKALEATLGIKAEYPSWTEFTHVTDQCIAEEFIEQQLDRPATKKDIEELQKNFRKILQQEKEEIIPIPGAAEFINLLKSKANTHVALATGCWKLSASIKLDAIGIDYFNIPFGNSDNTLSREDIVLNAIKLSEAYYQCSFDKTLYFGDGTWDFKTCQNLDIPLIGIDFMESNKLQELGVEFVFKNYLAPDEILASIETTLNPIKL